MKELISAAAEWLRMQSAAKREELRFAELGTYARGLEEGRADAMAEFGFDPQYVPGEDDE